MSKKGTHLWKTNIITEALYEWNMILINVMDFSKFQKLEIF